MVTLDLLKVEKKSPRPIRAKVTTKVVRMYV